MEVLRVPFVDLKAQYHLLKSEMDRSLLEVLEAGSFVLGEQLEKFEACFAQYLGCRRAVGVSSGLDALRLALEALDIGAGDAVSYTHLTLPTNREV